jgi:acyl-[acyl-carrier-protein]-phospholipid O-acyltransferase / long-chain-fatty-acid--[acyl-carrier-protein] ligase
MVATMTTPEIVDNQFEAFARKPHLNRHLAELAFRNLAQAPFRKMVVDLSRERKELSAGMILAVALCLAERWRDQIPGHRVGVVFPAGLGGILTNLALALLDKVAVNLNFTAGRNTLELCLAKAEIDTVITAGPVIDKVPDFPWPAHVIDLVKENRVVRKADVLKHFGKIVALPVNLLLRSYRVPSQGGEREAGLLFSSGSTGEPKGIALTHRNIVSNIQQVVDCHLLNRSQVLLACLPTFHSFGYTVTLWYPLLTGLKTVTVPSPLETKKIADAIEAEKATVLMGTPTFFRPFFKRVEPAQLASLKYVVGGAEKTPPGFAERWQQHFGSLYLEGYGLTETSPVASVNLPPYDDKPSQIRAGSVGRLVPGMRARVTNPSTGAVQPKHITGILELQGPNVFGGYLNDPDSTRAVFNDGWFATGDLARIDDEQFIFIEGRLSRFSKIGGEMVPHGKLEQVIAKVFQLEDADAPLVAVTGVSDPQKGEALILLAAVDIRPDLLRQRLVAEGIPNLWIPRIIRRVDMIPCLASGKLDLQGIARLAKIPPGASDGFDS